MDKLEKVLVSPTVDGWMIEIIDELGKTCFVHNEETFGLANNYGSRQGMLYQLRVEIQK